MCVSIFEWKDCDKVQLYLDCFAITIIAIITLFTICYIIDCFVKPFGYLPVETYKPDFTKLTLVKTICIIKAFSPSKYIWMILLSTALSYIITSIYNT